MAPRARVVNAILLAAALAGFPGHALAQSAGSAAAPPAADRPSPFDKSDPGIAEVRKLDWKKADFNSLAPKQKAAALMALNRGLINLGAQARVREELLIDYLDAHDLGPSYAAAKSAIPDPPPLTFDDLLKVATASVTSPQGAARAAGEFDATPDTMLARYLSLYERSARREMEETTESRWHVRSMGLFLQDTGKLDDFKIWSAAEQKRRDEELERQTAEASARSEQERQQRAEAYAQQQQQQQDRVAAQMEAALQQQQQAAASSSAFGSTTPPAYVEEPAWGYAYPYAVNNVWYYNSNAYRGYVRDKSQDAYDRWRQNHLLSPAQQPGWRPMPDRPMPAAARGGGLRR
jgi:hypothetical protein